jgi:hypothetical protein
VRNADGHFMKASARRLTFVAPALIAEAEALRDFSKNYVDWHIIILWMYKLKKSFIRFCENWSIHFSQTI